MWILSCDGDLFGGKRFWLRPGSSHLLGRTSGKPVNGETVRFINSKNVSRKHIILNISPAAPEDITHLSIRSHIEAVDASKTGTIIDGEKIKQESKRYEEGHHIIQLGTYEQIFHLTWEPVVLSFTNLPKRTRTSGRALAVEKERFAGTGVKLVTEYVTNKTTHTIAQKRNTVPGLQALVQAKWLVTESFADALAQACERQGVDADGQPIISALEQDFDTHWPKAEDYIVPTSGEPTPRPNEYLKPDFTRVDVFEGFTFIFLTTSQYEQLLPVITSGNGKALVFDFKACNGTIADTVNFVQEAAGKKEISDFRLSQDTGPGGLVVVRLKNVEDEENAEFTRGLDLTLDQRSMEQNEFLDAILMNDASGLRQPLKDGSQAGDGQRTSQAPPSSDAPPAANQQEVGGVQIKESPGHRTRQFTQSQMEEDKPQPASQDSSAPKWRNRRVITQSRFKGFDEFDPSQIVRVPSESPEPLEDDKHRISSTEQVDTDARSLASGHRDNRKRPAPAQEDEIEASVNMTDRLLPGAQAMKRRKLEAMKNGKTTLSRPSADREDAAANAAEPADKLKRNKKDTKDPVLKVDVKAQMRARKEREEEARRNEEVSNGELAIDPSNIHNPAKTESFQLPVRPPRESFTTGVDGPSQSWNPEWNGRKNFKRFRSNKIPSTQDGQNRQTPAESPRVFIRLDEVPKRGHGLGDDYWFESRSSMRSKNKSQSRSQASRGGPASVSDTSDAAEFRRRLQRSREEDAANASLDDGIVIDASPNITPTPTLRAASQSKAAGKRPAAQPMGPPPKRSRFATITNDDDSDDDPTAFRRKRR